MVTLESPSFLRISAYSGGGANGHRRIGKAGAAAVRSSIKGLLSSYDVLGPQAGNGGSIQLEPPGQNPVRVLAEKRRRERRGQRAFLHLQRRVHETDAPRGRVVDFAHHAARLRLRRVQSLEDVLDEARRH